MRGDITTDELIGTDARPRRARHAENRTVDATLRDRGAKAAGRHPHVTDAHHVLGKPIDEEASF